MLSRIFHIGFPILISATGVTTMALIAHFLQNGAWPLWNISKHGIVNFTFTMQMMTLLYSVVVLMIMYLYRKENFRTFFRFRFSSPGKSDWNSYAPIIAVAFTVGTAAMMSFNVMAEKGTINQSFFALLPLVFLFAATNAWSEEIFTRFVIAVGLYRKLPVDVICLISALIFGIPHFFFGTPNGLFGIIASGSLGWFMAKLVMETKSLGWAWFIHFLQDLMIFGAGAMIIAGKE